MFKTSQIITKTELLKNFEEVAQMLESEPQALLITRRTGDPLVLVNADIWERFLDERVDGARERAERLGESPALNPRF